MSSVSTVQQNLRVVQSQEAVDSPDQEGEDLTEKLLYNDVLILIFEKLSKEDLVRSAGVCRRWCVLSRLNCLWSPILEKEFGKTPRIDESYASIYSRCQNCVNWVFKWKAPTDEKISAFVRQGPYLLFQNRSTLICHPTLYSDTVVRIPHRQLVSQMRIIQNKVMIAGGSEAVTFRDLSELEQVEALEKHDSWVSGFSWSPDWLTTWTSLGKIIIWDPDTLKKINEIPVESKDIKKTVCWNSSLIVMSNIEPKLTFYDIEGNSEGSIEYSNEEAVVDMALYDQLLIVAKADGNIDLWEGEKGNVVKTISTGQSINVIDVAYDSLVIGGMDGWVTVWSLSDQSEKGRFQASENTVQQVKRTADELTVLDMNGELSVFHLSSDDAAP